VLEITPTGVVLVSERGRVLVPARLFQQQVAILEAEGEDD